MEVESQLGALWSSQDQAQNGRRVSQLPMAALPQVVHHLKFHFSEKTPIPPIPLLVSLPGWEKAFKVAHSISTRLLGTDPTGCMDLIQPLMALLLTKCLLQLPVQKSLHVLQKLCLLGLSQWMHMIYHWISVYLYKYSIFFFELALLKSFQSRSASLQQGLIGPHHLPLTPSGYPRAGQKPKIHQAQDAWQAWQHSIALFKRHVGNRFNGFGCISSESRDDRVEKLVFPHHPFSKGGHRMNGIRE